MGIFDRLFGESIGGSQHTYGTTITSNEVATRGFTETVFRAGYDSAEVIEFLNRAVATLDAYER